MPNLRVVSDNPADRATITPSSASGALAATNLQSDIKSAVWRATGKTSETLSLALTSTEVASCMHLVHCNLSPTATWRLQLTNEAAATNLALQSQTQNTATYTKTNTTSTGTLAADPAGTTTAVPIMETATTAVHTVQQSISLTISTTYTLSMFVKANGRTRIQLGNSTLGAFANFNLGTGALLTTGGSGYVSAGITAFPNSWYRIRLTFTTSAGGAQVMLLSLQDGTGTGSYLGVTTNGVYAWGWQCETGSTHSSYYSTTTTARARPLGFIDSWQAYGYDSGVVTAAPAPARVPRGWSAADAASAYAYGGGTHADLWFPQQSWVGARITIADPDNLQGYIEASRLVMGPYWSPAVGVDYGASVTPLDNTKVYDLESGDTYTEAGTRKRKMDLPLSNLTAAERSALFNIALGAGLQYPVLVSLHPESVDASLERDYTVYGRFQSLDAFSSPSFAQYASRLQIVEI